MKTMSSKVSKNVSSKGGDTSKTKSTKGLESSKVTGATTPRSFAQLHLNRLRKESEAIRSEARAMARLLGENEETNELRTGIWSELESLSAEVSCLEHLFKKSNDKVTDQAAWDAMQSALRKRHQAELSSLKTAAKLAGCKGKLRSAMSESDASYASTRSTQARCSEVDAGNVSDNSKGSSTNHSTVTPDTHTSDEDSKSDDKAHTSDEDSKSDEKDSHRKQPDTPSSVTTLPPSPTPPLHNVAPAAPQEGTVPTPRWGLHAPQQLQLPPRASIDDLDPFDAVLSHESAKSYESQIPNYKFDTNPKKDPQSEVEWTPRVLNGEDQHVHTPPESDDDLVANPRDEPISLSKLSTISGSMVTPRLSTEDTLQVQETLDEAEFAMMHAQRAFAAVHQARHRSSRGSTPRTPHGPSSNALDNCLKDTPRSATPLGTLGLSPDKSAPVFVHPPALMPVANDACLPKGSAFDATPGDAPLTARVAPQKKLEASELTPPPFTARGQRQADAQIPAKSGMEWKSQTDAVLKRAKQTLEAIQQCRDGPKIFEMDCAKEVPSRTPCFSPRQPVPMMPLASPRMMCSPQGPRPQPSPPKVLPATHTSHYKLPEESPLHTPFMRTPNSQQQAPAPWVHAAPNFTRQASATSLGPAEHAFANSHTQVTNVYARSVSRQMTTLSTSAAQSHRPWVFGRTM